jgi:hypothetical protein
MAETTHVRQLRKEFLANFLKQCAIKPSDGTP